jgi:hypothetical protein
MRLQNLERLTVISPVAIGGNQERAVDEIEIHIRRREALAVKVDSSWHRDLDDLKWPARLIGEMVQLFSDIAQDLVVFVLGIRLERDDDFSRADEPGKVVDVAISVIPGDSTSRLSSVRNSLSDIARFSLWKGLDFDFC